MRLHGMVTEGENMPSFQLACECPAELVGDTRDVGRLADPRSLPAPMMSRSYDT